MIKSGPAFNKVHLISTSAHQIMDKQHSFIVQYMQSSSAQTTRTDVTLHNVIAEV